MTGKETCIKNDWRVGDILENKAGQRVLITAIGLDLVLVHRPTFNNEKSTRLEAIYDEWRRVYRPRQLVGWRVFIPLTKEFVKVIDDRLFDTTRWKSTSTLFKLRSHAKNVRDGLGFDSKLISVYKVASRVRA